MTTTSNPVGKRREQQKQETYALILDSARALFESHGFEKTTIRSVATHAQIGLGTIYKHFETKTALLAAALYDDLVRLVANAATSIPDTAPLKDQLLHLAGFTYRYYTQRPKLSREYLSHFIFVDGEWAQKIRQFDLDYADTVTRMVMQAQAKGEVSEKKEGRYVALSFMAAYFFVLSDLFLRQRQNDPDQMLALLGHLIDQTLD